ncbi:MAG: hypothetical protein AB1Z19_08380 [Eubacteriales bacterium]
MNFKEAVENASTNSDLTRFASAYVIDYSHLSSEDLLLAVIKTAPQYYHDNNVQGALDNMVFNKDRNIRVLGDLILKTILLNSDDFISSHSDTENDILLYEQNVIRESAQGLITKDSEVNKNYELFQFILETAWENNNDISPDEKNLIEKIRRRLSITDYEYQIIEASINKYPKINNEVHTRKTIGSVRLYLQKLGLIISIRDSSGTDYDVLPTEIAHTIRKLLDIEIREYGYTELLKSKYVRNKNYLFHILEKGNVPFSQRMKTEELQALCINRVNPSVLLGGYSPKDGLDIATLYSWCQDLELKVSGQKNDLIQRIIEHYDEIRKRPTSDSQEDMRSIYFEYFEFLASRNISELRHQGVIEKDLQCERYFEEATDYIFEKYLNHKPLVLKGTEHPDGILSFNDRLIMWDNKSKETPVNLTDHMKQFERYISTSEKPVASFLVIGPSFTADSEKLCKKFSMSNNTTICLITASQLRKLALRWKNDSPFPLQNFRQSGLFDMDVVIS